MPREFRSQAELREICLDALRGREGFENVDDILIQPRDASAGGTNWTLAGFRPRVDNAALRGARDVISELCRSYQLRVSDAEGESSHGK
ncbi:MAG: hypothetical protein WDN02_00590 [Methylovirgula sp.]|uniref:hypothetical protein n=1 Tax=Methylovirgula sp. TaxID=1978224 RepID=UPI0030760648